MVAVLEQEELVSVGRAIPMRRVWAMPDKHTFNIPPIRGLVKSYLAKSKISVDPFARNKRWATHTNDLNPETAAESHLEAGEFLKGLVKRGVETDLVLFDPPYSLEQCKRAYEGVGRTVTMRDTQIWGRWTEHKRYVCQMTRPGAVVISFGWNSAGMGINFGFAIEQILIVCHGQARHDTIVTVERKVESGQGALAFNEPERETESVQAGT